MKKEAAFPYIPRPWIEHGGAITQNKRKSKRPLNPKKTCHIVFRSEIASGKRNLLRHQPMIKKVVRRSSDRFQIKIHQMAICSNHIHLLVKGKRRIDLQNFFRVVAGHIAQEILQLFPLPISVAAGNAPKLKGSRKFWALLMYSRIVNWGRDFKTVISYILQNTKEALGIIPYKPRHRRMPQNEKMTLRVECSKLMT